MFSAEPMAKYIRDHLDFDCFKRHYDEELGKNPKKYRYIKPANGNPEHLKWILGNGKIENVPIEAAEDYFGTVGVDNIRKQFFLLPTNVRSHTWFHVDTGLCVESGSGLVHQLEGNSSLETQKQFDGFNYAWICIDVANWIQCHVLKTKGVFCIIASVLNSSKFSQARCVEIFDEFKNYHTSSGEIKVNWCFFKIQEKVKGSPYLHSEKCYPYKTFQDIALLTHESYKGKVLIVCYSTTFSTTHAVCWDIDRKRILDCECRNNTVFTYTTFDADSLVAKSIVEALSTTINVPCVFSIAYWKDKSNAKRKR
jgi:hypothetical protein